MDLEVRWSPEAIEDLESIAEYIGRDSQYYAKAVVTEILSTSRSCSGFPLIGRIVPEIGHNAFGNVSSTATAWYIALIPQASKS